MLLNLEQYIILSGNNQFCPKSTKKNIAFFHIDYEINLETMVVEAIANNMVL